MSEKIDLLDEDKVIAEQKFACLSFISPEKIIKDQDLFKFERFVDQFEFSKNAELLTKFGNFISYKYNLDVEDIQNDLKEFASIEKDSLNQSVSQDYETYIDKNDDELTKEFCRINDFRTSVRGIKVRGVFPTQEEAELRCKMLREVDPNHDVYVGPVGLWIPFHPEAYKTGRVEYLEKELNQLMHEKKRNEDQAKTHFETRVKESKLNAIAENMKLAGEHGNRLTQTINEKGELIGTNEGSTIDKKLGVNASMEEIKRELFEGENVVMSQSDHGLSGVTKKIEN